MLLFLQCTAITQLMCGVQTAHYCVANLLLRYISTKLCRFQSKFDKVVVKTKEYTFYWDNKYITVSLLASLRVRQTQSTRDGDIRVLKL